ncbi:hypothetical protein BDY21DRAFT_356389 [Lineolata rhizophorae]|uniref:DUF3433 domain protein n=1 Tax=Lineolata rhizophorae TaxID=578093 RepID=A0A6A6NPL1_9PEZI|nr:hypothetical protein BDY21DRAFT_356389 [Lineolata rhizophorae]
MGRIVAVEESLGFDVSNFDGNPYEARNILGATAAAQAGQKHGANKSYYFPPDPEKPSWRPMSMEWWYILTLTMIALGLGGYQEYLCQYSIQQKAKGSGLIEFHSVAEDVSVADYFLWKYAPTMILVTYGVMWQISDFEVKRLEPYYQLSQPKGATAAESLNIDYLTFFSYLIPFKALRFKHWAVALSSTATLFAGSLTPVLQSASIITFPPKREWEQDPNGKKFLLVDPAWSRATSAALYCVGICGIMLMWQLRRKSGLLSDPKGIAGIAAMATRSHILQDFQGLDTKSHNAIHQQLKHRRYILHKSSLWQGEYIRNTAAARGADDVAGNKKLRNPHPRMLTLQAGVPYIVSLLIFAGLLPVFIFNERANKVTDAAPWLLVLLATGLKLLWSTLECDVRMVEPFYILSERQAPAKTLTMDYTGTMPGWLPIKAAIGRNFLVALVGLGAILTEVMTVCVSSFGVDGRKFLRFDFNGADDGDGNRGGGQKSSDETFKSFWISFILVQLILLYLAVVAGSVYARRRHRFYPRQPGTIASVLAYIHQSRMLMTFVGCERLTSSEMTKFLEKGGKRYALGWFDGRDGAYHCGIDEEPIDRRYEFGVDPRSERIKVVGTWEHFETAGV